MLLAIDVGNSNIVTGVYDGDHLVGDCRRMRTERERTADEHGAILFALLERDGLAPRSIDAVALSSVVPTMNEALLELSRSWFGVEPFVVGPGVDAGIAIRYEPVSDVGADRICNAVGAFARYGGPAVVVDFGTATTFDAVAANGDYAGGAIVPGIGISMDALFRHASRLYRVELIAPPAAIGTNTVHAMQSGLVFGYAGQTDAMVGRFRAELGADARVIATGGLAPLIARQSKTIEHVDQLVTLEGLRLLFERSRA